MLKKGENVLFIKYNSLLTINQFTNRCILVILYSAYSFLPSEVLGVQKSGSTMLSLCPYQWGLWTKTNEHSKELVYCTELPWYCIIRREHLHLKHRIVDINHSLGILFCIINFVGVFP